MKRLPKIRHENLSRYGFWIEAIVGDESCVKKSFIDRRELQKFEGFLIHNKPLYLGLLRYENRMIVQSVKGEGLPRSALKMSIGQS